jgi:hypothetical protein
MCVRTCVRACVCISLSVLWVPSFSNMLRCSDVMQLVCTAQLLCVPILALAPFLNARFWTAICWHAQLCRHELSSSLFPGVHFICRDNSEKVTCFLSSKKHVFDSLVSVHFVCRCTRLRSTYLIPWCPLCLQVHAFKKHVIQLKQEIMVSALEVQVVRNYFGYEPPTRTHLTCIAIVCIRFTWADSLTSYSVKRTAHSKTQPNHRRLGMADFFFDLHPCP